MVPYYFLISLLGMLVSLPRDHCSLLRSPRQTDERDPDFVLIKPEDSLDSCTMPDGTRGRITLLEDCEHLHLLGDSPPELIMAFRGSSIMICCPVPFEPSETFKGNDDFTDAIDYEIPFQEDFQEYLEQPDPCSNVPGTKCTDLDHCSEKDVSGSEPPWICGWNREIRVHKFCCKGQNNSSPMNYKPRHHRHRKSRYECEDYHEKCKIWSEKHPESCNDDFHPSTLFMTIACMKSCNICGKNGCTDDFTMCPTWARKTAGCASYPDVMAIYCRATCGTCGFKSPRNQDIQMINDKSFSSIDDQHFFCGESKSRKELENYVDDSRIIFDHRTRRKRNINEANLELFHYATQANNSARNLRCGAVIISDRFAIFAAHCTHSFGTSILKEQTRTVLIRDGTDHEDRIEVRRIFVHPGYKYPSLYDDIALLELGRRIDYNFERYGDSPACLSKEFQKLEGKKGHSEGYGFTEHGMTSDVLLTTNVTIISNSDCSQYLSGNVSSNLILKTRLQLALSNGINDQLLCTVGERKDGTDIYSGPCEGDSGGPLYVNHGFDPDFSGSYRPDRRRRQAVEGIVSGGLGCGKNVPSWYTKVSSYRNWIKCIMENVKACKGKSEIEEICKVFSGNFDKENEIR